MKKILTLMLLCAAVVCTSCKKDDPTPSKPDGFGLQGIWTVPVAGGMSFQFDALPNPNYAHIEGTLTSYGVYTYNPETDKLTLQPNLDGVPTETYDVKWVNDQWKSFTLVATGNTPKTKEATYTLTGSN